MPVKYVQHTLLPDLCIMMIGVCVIMNANGNLCIMLTLTVLVTTIYAQWEGMGDVASARYEPALLPPCPTIRVLSYSN